MYHEDITCGGSATSGHFDGYAVVHSNLQVHAAGWPAPAHLRDIVANGQTGNGMSDVGEGRWSRGARLVTSAVLKPDPRPLHIIMNGGVNTLAQALFEYRAAHTLEEVAAYVAKLRVFDNQGQDEAGAWICREFPEMHYIRGVAQTRAFGGSSNEKLGPHVWKPYAYNPVVREFQSTGDLLNWMDAVPSQISLMQTNGASCLYHAMFPLQPTRQFFRIRYRFPN